MTLKCILRALFLLVVNVLSMNYVYASCDNKIPGLAFNAANISVSFSAEDFNNYPMGIPLASGTLGASATPSSMNDLNSHQLVCDDNPSRTYQFWAQNGLANLPTQLLSPLSSYRPATGNWYGFKLNEYIAVGLAAKISRYKNLLLRNCLLNPSTNISPCSDINGFQAIHPVGVIVQLYKIKNLPAGSAGFDLNQQYNFSYRNRPLPDGSPLTFVGGTINLDFSVSSDISTPELIIDNPVVRFAGVAGDEVIQDVSVSIRNSNAQKLFPQEYTVSLLTPNRSNERSGLVGGTQFALMVNGNELRVDGNTSESWWPELDPNATYSIPLRFRFNIAGPPGQHSSILTLETAIP